MSGGFAEFDMLVRRVTSRTSKYYMKCVVRMKNGCEKDLRMRKQNDPNYCDDTWDDSHDDAK